MKTLSYFGYATIITGEVKRDCGIGLRKKKRERRERKKE